jgi:hypothetical protein
MAFYIKQNDTSPAIRAVLKDGDGVPINLDGATVRFHMRPIGETTVTVDAAASVVSPSSAGIVEYSWDAGDTDAIGSFKAEFEVTYSDNTIETFPNNGYISVVITGELS